MSPARSGPRRHATMRDVAALAGVGLKTVSRVVNDEPNVSAETKERVERAIDALGFEPNHGAGSLRRVRWSHADDRADPRRGRQPVLGGHQPGRRDRRRRPRDGRLRRELRRRHRPRAGAGGRVQPETGRRPDHHRVRTRPGLPAERARPRHARWCSSTGCPDGLLADVVLTDNVAWAAVATEHLIDHGHRRIAFLGDDRGHPDRPGPAARLRAGHGRRRPRGARRLQRGRPHLRRAGGGRGRATDRAPGSADGADHGAEPDHHRRGARPAPAGSPVRDRPGRLRRPRRSPTCSPPGSR